MDNYYASKSAIVHTRFLNPAAIVGVAPFENHMFRQKLYQEKCDTSVVRRLSQFLETPFVRRVSLRMHIRIVKFCRSTCDVQIVFSSG
jgi:hypothetical protein